MFLTVLEQINLTPSDADSPSFLIKLGANGVLSYEAGDWVTVKGQNPRSLVLKVMDCLSLNPRDKIDLRRQGEVTIEQALTHYLELTLVDPAILNKLIRHYGYQAWSSRAEMQHYAEGRDVLDLLLAFPKLCAMGKAFLTLLSPLAPRYYSTASSPTIYPNEIHLLYKAIRFYSDQRVRLGVTSNTMAQAKPGDQLDVEIKPNAHFKLPENPRTAIVMMAAGTGLAPFLGFMQQRVEQPSASRNIVYFGETHRQTRFLCQSSLESWQRQGALGLYTAFSRDQDTKVYVQDLLAKNLDWLELWQSGANLYICGDKLGLAQGIEQQIKQIWMQHFNWDSAQANQAWLEAKQQKRIQLDVY
ncbi:NADP oxidoreductase [Thiomicrospira sp. R3]|uniref:NADP oxidoreductase n=1 Tax=Thiomicrospira sp. R3 TaxID=3035472 RepID=UPI00259B22EB|nr:NADP oxidoreductase [Thiomicrospira sp. R3]WFE67761.1 NADP oxidoreductase [Thiomicrospira sp. R3]